MSTTPSTPDLFREVFPDWAEKASTVCVDMGISTVGVLEAALEDKELTDELSRRCADGGLDGESETTTMTEVADAKSASSSTKSPGTASEVVDANKNYGGGGGGVVVVEIFPKLRKARLLI
ncbi:hypothetical protein Pmar_PMAR001958 [Perkinsus marinus ATCC 50983]|uniref:Uncharacterized protein n=1 Tax=Perkinsus marinus (strain ATCC 50983 / TXsc) TaxID=423536 RepID=C5KKR1_PERM5|nr:hypothetical protein Pmar_PMAR007402 [Perkinsus marinus ATCC 50983]XP_002783137.1 hypothetical protein Pmar_PMAR001958 [Perkinsus marinus ATCC 50983]EER14885.1 hypothetical protein Pmar_PMAR007402 [Perkinsus marinus ATCC 50983]EER14933.1 hypothetical protein Pmar_PMAR001958 [Perkinsus marinus ATCC 50983]|eukprot:XP_002783089.1 hypothetical protein Pmar_PMAR007402 [Perkinsus marinus ATCC 50983]